MLFGVSTVTEVCVTGSMRTTPSLNMRGGIQVVGSLKASTLNKVNEVIIQHETSYRSDTVNSNSFVCNDFLRIKWKFKLNYAL